MQNTEILMELHDKACEARHLHGSPTFNLEASQARSALETEIELISIQYREARQFSNQVSQERIRLLSKVEELEQEVLALKSEALSLRANGTAKESTPVHHPDNIAVDAFADALKAKLAKQRAKGYGGWDDPEQCPAERLQTMLIDHIAKGDPVDVGNFAMMLWSRQEPTSPTAAPVKLPSKDIASSSVEHVSENAHARYLALHPACAIY